MRIGRTAKWAVLVVLLLVVVVVLVPLLWLIMGAFSYDGTVQGVLPLKATLANFNFLAGTTAGVPFWRWLANSIIVSGAAALIAVVVDSLAAFGLARVGFRGSRIVFAVVVSSLSVPFVATLVPLYLEMSAVNLLNTYEALIAPFTASAFGVFLLYQFFRQFPGEIEEAARVDGAGFLRIWWRLAVPISAPAMVTLGIITFMNAYNDFFWPLVAVSDTDMRTLTVGVAITAIGQFSTNYGQLMALTLLSVIPMVVVFIVAQRKLVAGIGTVGTVG